jgi:hypothetical protein
LYLGHWPEIREYINILDKKNWDLFGIYTGILWSAVLLFVPGLIFLLGRAGNTISKSKLKTREVFLNYAGALLPFSLLLWMAFVIPMLFVNITFVFQSASDPFGWGWDFFGTANTPWHQFLPRYIPWIQAILLLAGLHLSLRNNLRNWRQKALAPLQQLWLSLPFTLFLTGVCAAMLFFFTN